MKYKIIGWILIVIFGANLLFSLFLGWSGERIAISIIQMGFSLFMLYIGYRLVRRKSARPINGQPK